MSVKGSTTKGNRNGGPVRVGRPGQRQIGSLKQLGFTEYEAKVYLTLLESNPATAYEIAKSAGLPRANVYSAFDSLLKKGAVQPISEGPVRYAPLDPKVTFENIARTTSELCAKVSDELAALTPSKARDYVWYLSGREDVHHRISQILDSAKRHIWIKAHESALIEHTDELKAAGRRGVRLLVILFGHESGRSFDFGPKAEVYLHEGTGVVVGMGKSLITVTADFETALTADLDSEAHGAFTQSEPVVNLAESVIRHEVYLAEIFALFGSAISDQFGPLMQRLRRKYLPSDQVKTLDQAVREMGEASSLSPTKLDVLIRAPKKS